MILKDIISAKAIKDELFLLRTNVKSLMLSWRITRTPYLLSIILVYFSYIAMPGLTFNSLPEYEESVVSLIGYTNLVISLVIFSLLAIRRVLDVNLNILVVGLLILSLFPSNECNNDYGLSNCIEKVGSSFIRIDYGGFEQFLDEFSLYKILPILKKILSLELLNWKGRISRGELIYYYIVYQFMVLLLVILIYSIGTILPTIFLKNIFLSSIVAIFMTWRFIYLLKVLIQRLHDSYSSAFWLFGLFIPYVNVYVLYLILFKGSWRYIDSSVIGDNISH